MKLIIPENYDPVLDLRQTQEAIKYISDTFQKEIGRALQLSSISAPLFVPKSSGNLRSTGRQLQSGLAGMLHMRMAAGSSGCSFRPVWQCTGS